MQARVWSAIRGGVLAAGLLAAAAAVADGFGTTYRYDWRSGNSYSIQHNFDGSHTVRGWNAGTGSSWTTTISPSGDMRGYDARGNYWTYDRGTGLYMNHGTGEIRLHR